MGGEGFFVGVDCGSQGTKAVVVDGGDGRVVGSGYVGYGLIEGLPPGHREQHPSTWVEAMTKAIRDALTQAKVEGKIEGIGVSGQQHGFVPLDGEGKIIRPTKLWNDTSTAEECRWLIERLGGVQEVVKLTGNTILPGFTAGKILWLRRHEPANFARLATALLPHDYLNFWLTGRAIMEPGDASGTALMDVRTRRWRREVVDAIDPSLMAKLPEIQSSGEPAGMLRREAAEALGLPEGTLVSAGGGDNMMGAIGTGNTKSGIVSVSLGTSGTIYAYSGRPVVDPLGEAHAFCDSTGAWLPLACTMNVTVATEAVRGLLGLSYDELEEAVKATPVGSNGVLLLPYLTGERTPNVPDGKGVLYGLTPGNLASGNLARAPMEGATMGLNFGFNRLREMGIEPGEVRLTGGGSRNRAWRRMCADVFGVETVRLEVDEGAAYGAALQSLWTRNGGSISDITDSFVHLDEATRSKPDPGNVEKYRRLQRLQDRLSVDLRGTFSQ
ncbi:TPA: xylulokinase [Candidatus Bathyarchaeota archaeon]|nr:xylulokinase [Candidatus Bathyarchaeota archaeon]